MQQLMSEYGKSGKVAWVYRQYPIVQLHSKAPKEAEALECAAELGGNEKFWDYTDRLYTLTNSNDSLDSVESSAYRDRCRSERRDSLWTAFQADGNKRA